MLLTIGFPVSMSVVFKGLRSSLVTLPLIVVEIAETFTLFVSLLLYTMGTVKGSCACLALSYAPPSMSSELVTFGASGPK